MSNRKLFGSVLVAGTLAGSSAWVSAQDSGNTLSLEAREQALKAREATLRRREQAVESHMQQQLSGGRQTGSGSDMTDALPNAKAGQCFAKVLTPAKYETITEKVMVREAANRIEIIPAKYQIVEEKVEIKAASEKIIEVPAVYKKIEEKILMSPERMVWHK